MSTDRPWAGNAGRYGSLGEYGEWQVAQEHYYWDRLEAAYEIATRLGLSFGARTASWFRLIEAEHITRQRGQVRRLNDWLELEAIPEETEGAPSLAEGVTAACEETGRRFGWEPGAPTLVSVLAEESDAPWTVGRYGYMMDKYPFDKICIPRYSVESPDELQRVVSHEYAHVISLNLSGGLVPRWLDEAIAQVAGRDEDAAARQDFAAGREPWLDAHSLELAFGAEREDAVQGKRLWLAYQQSAQIGRFLVSLGGEQRLGDLLRGFTNNTMWTDLKMRLAGQPEVEEALQEVYQLTTRDLFMRSLESVKRAASP